MREGSIKPKVGSLKRLIKLTDLWQEIEGTKKHYERKGDIAVVVVKLKTDIKKI